MEKVIYKNHEGLGIILLGNENETDYFEDKEFVINGKTLRPGDFTDLDCLLFRKIRYVGILKKDEKCFDNEVILSTGGNCIVFHLGDDVPDLFDTKKYYSCWYYISETRLANKYSERTARDYNYKNGKWK